MAREMLDVMHRAKGVGLAANQVGEPVRLIVVGPTQEGEKERALVNPTIKAGSGKMVEEEGCLSVPGVSGRVRRFSRVVVEARTLEWEPVTIEAEELLARVLQHEIDHLEGRLFVDRLSQAAKVQTQGLLRGLEQRQDQANVRRL